jgi:transcriptional regulator with XRE-family HTH domain
MTTQLTITDISARLRAIRLSKSLSLNDVEALSKGQLKAVVLGSYERGARTLSVKRALYIARLYGVPLETIFSEEKPIQVFRQENLIIDLRRVNRHLQNFEDEGEDRYISIGRFARHVTHSRQDWNGEVLSIREGDLPTIALMLDMGISETISWLERDQILLRKRSR